MKALAKEFREFIARGSVLDLAVGIIVGGAFTKIVNALVNDIVMPLLGFFTGKVDLTSLKYTIAPATESAPELSIKYGSFMQSCLDFFIIALSVFLMIKMLNSISLKNVTQVLPIHIRAKRRIRGRKVISADQGAKRYHKLP